MGEARDRKFGERVGVRGERERVDVRGERVSGV